MVSRTDAALATVVLAAVVIAVAAVDASIRWPAAAVGGLGTIAFELAATRAHGTVRFYWERPVVQGASVVLALVGVAAGAVIAPSSVLSFALGSLVTYLAYLVGTVAVQ
ncbi:hypothetical protein [Halopiger goleimassiliensis]|uniref:hypothetical protein n=1 Tax=Halopiger goleimassiliensis TaxID=1293048 RepID=UPI0006776BC0|nr:hypothetical protein [Halopiger goleimassiliensis]